MQSPSRSSGLSWRVLGAVVAVGSILLITVWHSWGELAVSYIDQPFNRFRQWVAGNERTSESETATMESLKQQLLSVSRELNEVKQQLAATESIEKINEYLAVRKLNAVNAAVIGYSPDPGVASITIQGGRRQGVKNGQAVIADGVIVGTITRADQMTAVVRLVTDSFSKVLVKVQNDQQSRGILVGERGLAIAADYIPQGDDVQVGQLVVTSGLDPLIPADILVGTIERVNSRAGELFKQAVVRSVMDFNRLQIVAVISGYGL